ncbi:MAG: 16S rRNA (uracil(1498)-N(3))-methyltransferase [Bacteroidales bacterium]|nr:16S rRNA (uracil(1498)-N(3))-methyltransferase [Bacteroidales bacterium]
MQLFYVPELINGSIEPDEMELRHLKVLRKKEGDSIRICDGKGHYSDAIILSLDKRSISLQVVEIHEVTKSAPRLTLMISPLKNAERFEWMLEKCTELGVGKIIPLICERTESPLRKMDRLQRIIRSATMQSKQYFIPELTDPLKFEDIGSLELHGQKFIAWCERNDRKEISETLESNSDAVVMIGPEGDFTADEVLMANELGFQAISLGANRLRTETAGVYSTAVFYMKNT